MNENINKVIYGTSTLIDLTEDTVSPDRMYKGDIAHAADGSIVTGTAEITVDGTTLIMPEGLCNLIGTIDPDTNHWVRPDYLPDLSSVYNEETNTLWMTVDATGRIPDPHVSIALKGAYTVQVGTIQNGSFVAETTESKSSNATWTKVWTPAPNLYPVLKFTTSGNLTYFQLKGWTSGDGHVYVGQQQPIIEMIGDMYSMDSAPRTPYFTEYEKIMVHGVTATESLRYRWQNAYCLQELDISDWDTSGWSILNNLSHTWYYCNNLVVIDGIEDLVTSTWNINNLSNTWDCCISLKKLDLHKWDVSNWVVTSLNSTWSYCWELELLDIGNWDTSGWAVTALNSTWNSNRKLRKLDLSSWNTSNWAVTGAMNSTWANCYLIPELDLSNWETSKWTVTGLQYTWQTCCSLRELKISNWDTSKWTVNTLQYTWQACRLLTELDLSAWDTSKWTVTTMYSTWDSCHSLETLGIGTWDTSGWAVTVLRNTWSSCWKLTNLPISDWDVSNWAVTDLTQPWTNCYSLKSLDLSKWNVSNWAVTDAVSTFRNLYQLKELNISTWNTSNWPMTGNSGMNPMFGYTPLLTDIDLSCFDLSKFYIHQSSSSAHPFDWCRALQHLTFGTNNNGKLDATTAKPLIRFDWSPLLTPQSILNIFNALKSGVTGKTVQLGSQNLNKMTAAEKAIATNKGWTLT